MNKIKPSLISNILSLGVNLLLIILKLVVGFIFNSISLVADGFDSVLDLVSAGFAGIGERISRKPADKEHPFGHHKFQMAFSIAIALTLFTSSFIIASEAIDRLRSSQKFLNFDFWVLTAALVSFIAKMFLSVILVRIGKNIQSPVIIANAKNYRTDAFASILVAIAFIGSYFSLWWLDPVCAFLIVALIIFTGFDIIKIALPELLDRGAPLFVVQKLKEVALTFPEVKEVHIIRLRPVLGSYTGDFHILLDPQHTILEGHAIAEEVKARLEEESEFQELLIHIEPFIPEERLEI